jgi:hypothetical protein
VIVWSQARQAQSIVEFVRLTRDITPELTIEDAEAEMETRISLPFVETEVGGDLAFFGLSLSVLLLNMYLLSVLETIGVLMPNASADDLVGWICFLNVKRLRGLIVLTLRPAPAENGMSATHPYIFRPAVPAVDDEDE